MHCIPLPVHHILMWSIPLVSLNHQRSIDMSINLLKVKLRSCCTYTMTKSITTSYNIFSTYYYATSYCDMHHTILAMLNSFNLETQQYYSLGMLQLQPISYSKIICTLPTYVSSKITGYSSILSQQINLEYSYINYNSIQIKLMCSINNIPIQYVQLAVNNAVNNAYKPSLIP